MTWIWLIMGWLVCGFFGAGIWFAYFQGEYPTVASKREDLSHAIMWGLFFGPFSIICGFFLSGFLKHGWRLK